jgi:hypothetical protein
MIEDHNIPVSQPFKNLSQEDGHIIIIILFYNLPKTFPKRMDT